MGDKVKIYSLENVEGLAEKTVTIVGYVKNPGQYPLYSGLNVSELLFLSGGINDDQWSNNLYKDRLDIIRLNQKTNEKKIIQTDIRSILSDSKNSNINPILMDGDVVRVYSSNLVDLSQTVTIEGAVKSPSNYEFKVGMTIKDIILEAGGLQKDIHKFRVDISSINPENKDLKTLSSINTFYMINDLSIFDSQTANTKNFPNLKLKPYDVITIRPDPISSLKREYTFLVMFTIQVIILCCPLKKKWPALYPELEDYCQMLIHHRADY